jgi:hypothetical protein
VPTTREHTFVPSSYAVVRLEELDCIAKIRADLIQCYQPVNSEELFAVERLALARQSLLRLARMETGMYTAFLNESLDPEGRPLSLLQPELVYDKDVTAAQNRNFLVVEGFRRINKGSTDLALFLRFQAQTERLYRRAIEEFERIRALRDVLPNDTLVDPAPPPPVMDYVPFRSPIEDQPMTEPTPDASPEPAEPPSPSRPTRRKPAAAKSRRRHSPRHVAVHNAQRHFAEIANVFPGVGRKQQQIGALTSLDGAHSVQLTQRRRAIPCGGNNRVQRGNSGLHQQFRLADRVATARCQRDRYSRRE